MASRPQATRPRQGDDVRELWRHVDRAITILNQLGLDVDFIKSNYKPRRALDTDGSGNSNFNYRGMYDPVATYMLGDVVKMGSGTSSGLYYCFTDNNTNAPDSGIGWTALNNPGQWL